MKPIYCIIILLVCSCNTVQPSRQANQEYIQLIDTLIDGNHIRMTISILDSVANNTCLHVFHNDMVDSILLKDYYDADITDALLFRDQQKQIVTTWIAKTKHLFLFVLPHYPSMGLFAYKINHHKIEFITTSDNRPIYSDGTFYAQFDSDIITSCHQASARNIYGATIWKLGARKNEFEETMTIANDTYLITDSLKFVAILDSVYSER